MSAPVEELTTAAAPAGAGPAPDVKAEAPSTAPAAPDAPATATLEASPFVLAPAGTEKRDPPPAETEATKDAPAAAAAEGTEGTILEQDPFTKFAARLPSIVEEASHKEMWGVQLSDPETHIPTKVVLQKFLRANNNDAAAAEKQLLSALQWRKKVDPTSLVNQTFDVNKYAGLGYVTIHRDEAGKETVITWNIYGAVKDYKKTFGDVEDFVKWRAALMELGTQKLNLNSVTTAIPDDGDDPYQMIQVHDYLSVSFFRMDPHVKAASKEVINVLGTAYPELLAHKYFVNVPAIMGWMYAAMKLFLAPATLKKFHPMSSGTTLATELPGVVDSLPKEYGGKGTSVQEQGEIVKLADLKGGATAGENSVTP